MQHAGEHARGEDRVRLGIVFRRVHLGREQDELVGLHDLFQRANAFFTADEERDDHVRENDDVAQGQDRIAVGHAGG